ncbi:hypothetical protein [Prochlorococcus sp. MIT 0604]|uniref:hypothetical protein n=1 Tax=Prochlorococcus sp. MIT 0604 TaxID=1501268 RepID=UPI0004F5C2AE|nr:hypothetical protein [Prochlorococcus sp. MIT 0604]AIQ95499.1 hypothetical protein EW14_1488 [Prochlorococcus sp. MIT 0604]
MINLKITAPTFFDELNENLHTIFDSQYYVDLRSSNKIEYSDIDYKNYKYIIGKFIKCFKETDGEIIMVQDLMGNSGYAYYLENEIFKFDEEFKIYSFGENSNDELSVDIIKNSSFVKGSSSVFPLIKRFIGFSELKIKGQKIFETPISLTDIDKLFSLNRKSLNNSLKSYVNCFESKAILFSGGSDSNFIKNLLINQQKTRYIFSIVDKEYESNIVDLENIKKSNIKVDLIDLDEQEVADFINSSLFKDLIFNFKGYSNSLFQFYLTICKGKIKEDFILSGQGADTVGYLGPSEKFYFNGFFPRSVMSLLSRLRIFYLILFKDNLEELYWYIFNDINYKFIDKKRSIPEYNFVNRLIRDINQQNRISYLDKKFLILIIAKTRSFGSGSDIKSFQYVCFKLNKKIIFPLNNFCFFLLSLIFLKEKSFKSILFPKYWYANDKRFFRKRIRKAKKSIKKTKITQIYKNLIKDIIKNYKKL